MQTCAALLLLNLPTPADSFIALSNLLNRSLPLSLHTNDTAALDKIYTLLVARVATSLPRLSLHLNQIAGFNANPGALVNEVLRSLFTQSLTLDCVTRLWDVWVFEGDSVLIRAAVAMLGMMESRLMDGTDLPSAVRVMQEGLNTAEESWMDGLKTAGKSSTGSED